MLVGFSPNVVVYNIQIPIMFKLLKMPYLAGKYFPRLKYTIVAATTTTTTEAPTVVEEIGNMQFFDGHHFLKYYHSYFSIKFDTETIIFACS